MSAAFPRHRRLLQLCFHLNTMAAALLTSSAPFVPPGCDFYMFLSVSLQINDTNKISQSEFVRSDGSVGLGVMEQKIHWVSADMEEVMSFRWSAHPGDLRGGQRISQATGAAAMFNQDVLDLFSRGGERIRTPAAAERRSTRK